MWPKCGKIDDWHQSVKKKSPGQVAVSGNSHHSFLSRTVALVHVYTRQGVKNLGWFEHSQAPTSLRP